VASQWFSPGTPVSSSIKTDCHDITEILLNIALNTITLTPKFQRVWCGGHLECRENPRNWQNTQPSFVQGITNFFLKKQYPFKRCTIHNNNSTFYHVADQLLQENNIRFFLLLLIISYVVFIDFLESFFVDSFVISKTRFCDSVLPYYVWKWCNQTQVSFFLKVSW